MLKLNFVKNFLINLFDKTFLKFIVVGIINTVVGFSIMFVFYNVFHFGYWLSSGANYIVGSAVSYLLNRNYTFKSRIGFKNGIIPFILNICLCYFLAYGLAQPIVGAILSRASLNVRDNISLFVGMCLFVILNFLGQKFYVFRFRN